MTREAGPAAGYSGTPLVRKLGIKAGMSCAAINAPRHYRSLLVGLPDDVTILDRATSGHDLVHVFVRARQDLVELLQTLRARIAPNGMIWVSWPKKASRVETDVTEDVVRAAALSARLVDVKVCAVDETWSGLKLVIRKADRR